MDLELNFNTDIFYEEEHMKTILFMAPCIAGVFFSACSSLFPTNYERVDAERVRVLDYIYEPAEAAPGEIVNVYTLLAGAGAVLLHPAEINWTVSYNVLSNSNGVDTALGIEPLKLQSFSEKYFSENTRCFVYAFRIPDSAVFNSVSIPEVWTSLVPKECQSEIPEFIDSLSKAEVINFVHTLAAKAKIWGTLLAMNPASEDSLLQADTAYLLYKNKYSRYIPALLQLLTIKIKLFSNILGAQKVRSAYSVRYNNCFKDIPGSRVYVNKNPVIDSVGIYRVKKEDLLFFDPRENNYEFEFIRLFRWTGLPDTVSLRVVEIDRKCSYFVAGFAGKADSSMTVQAAWQNGPATTEGLRTQWYFQLDPKEIAGISPYDYMNINNRGSFIDKLYPPADEKIKTFTLWLEVSDSLCNEINRPQGSIVAEVQGRFEYSTVEK